MNVIGLLSKINDQKIQKIVTNNFEQGNAYTKRDKLSSVTNKYIDIPDMKSAPPVVAASMQCVSIFEKIAMLMENGVILDKPSYKSQFYNIIEDDVYRSVSKRHVALKRDMFEFVFEEAYKLPSNKDVIRLFQRIIDMNVVVVCADNKWFVSFMLDDPGNGKTVVVTEKRSVGTFYDTYAAAIQPLIDKHLRERVDFGSLKMTELQAYARTYGIDIVGCKKKTELVERLKTA